MFIICLIPKLVVGENKVRFSLDTHIMLFINWVYFCYPSCEKDLPITDPGLTAKKPISSL